jgi:ABC-2 type transport system permease protein
MISKNDIDLYKQFVKTIFKMRYKGSLLGFFWVLLKPFFMFIILYVVFSSVSGQVGNLSSRQYAVYLLSGLVIFTFFQEGITWGMGSIMERADLILKINFKRDIVVISSITMSLINFGINLLIIAVIGTILDIQFTVMGVSYILLIGFVMFLAMYGIAFFTSIWMVYVRDLAHITELGLQLMFYASAVFFPIEMVPERFRFIVEYNPIAIYIQSVREALTYGNIVNLDVVLGSLAVAIILVIVGNIYFKHNVKRVAEHF